MKESFFADNFSLFYLYLSCHCQIQIWTKNTNMALAHLKDEPWTTAIPDDEWNELKQGVPSKDEAFIKQFISGREALIQQEKNQRRGESPKTCLYFSC